MDTEEKYVSSYELSERNQQESQAILRGDKKNVITLEGWKSSCDLWKAKKNKFRLELLGFHRWASWASWVGSLAHAKPYCPLWNKGRYFIPPIKIKFGGVYIHFCNVISICVAWLCAMGGNTRIKSGVLLLPVQMWTGLGETVMQYLQADPPAMKSSTDFHSARFRSSLPSPKNTQKRSMLGSNTSKFSKSILNIYNLENF